MVAYELDPSASLADEIRRVVTEHLADAISTLDRLDDIDADDFHTAVHDVRKRCKATRAVARLVRSSIGDEFVRFNKRVREAAETLAPIRDARATLVTLDDLRAAEAVEDDPALIRVRDGQSQAAAELTRDVRNGDPGIERARRLLVAAGERVERWQLHDTFEPLEAGLRRTYGRGRKALRRAGATPTDEHLHEWRKGVKNLWYQTRLIEQAAPSVLAPLVERLDDLADALGDDHDLAVLVERLTADPERYGGRRDVERTVRLARARQDDLRRRSLRLGATIYAEKPAAFARRMAVYWDVAERDGPELLTGGIARLSAD